MKVEEPRPATTSERLRVVSRGGAALVARFEVGSHLEISKRATEWRELCLEGPCNEPFYQPEWFKAFTEAFCPDREILLATVGRGNELRGVLPLMPVKSFFGRIPAVTLRSLSCIHSCRFDLVHGARDSNEVGAAICSQLEKTSDWDVIELLDVPVDGAAFELCRLAGQWGYLIGIWPTRRMPYLNLSSSDSPFANCPTAYSGSRARLEKKEKLLEQKEGHPMEIVIYSDMAAVKQFLELEASGWKGKKKSAIAVNPQCRVFYKRVAYEAARRGRLKLYTLSLGGKPIAMHFGLAMDRCYYIPKIAYDESYSRYSPGLLLMKEVIKDLTRKGMRRFDFLGPSMEWKRVWTSSFREHANCYIFQRGCKGTLLHALTMRGAAMLRRGKYLLFGDPQVVH